MKSIPEELRPWSQWVLWCYEDRGGPKLTKVPYQARARLYRARSDDPRTWATFETAIEMWQCHGEHVAGIGFVFSADDPYCGIDLDGIWRSDADEGAPWAMRILERFSDTYSEGSPSDTGIKIWCRAKSPRCGKWRIEHGAIEIYDHSRFFTVTGRSGKVHIIADHQSDVEALVANLDKTLKDGQRQVQTRAIPEVIPKGQRHRTLLSLAGSMAWRGVTPEAIEAALSVTNEKQCDPALSARTYSQDRGQHGQMEEVRAMDTISIDQGWLPKKSSAPKVDLLAPGLHDTGNAERIVLLHGANMRYCVLWKKWVLWDDQRMGHRHRPASASSWRSWLSWSSWGRRLSSGSGGSRELRQEVAQREGTEVRPVAGGAGAGRYSPVS